MYGILNYLSGYYNSLVGIITPCVLVCVLKLAMSGGTYSIQPILNDSVQAIVDNQEEFEKFSMGLVEKLLFKASFL